MNRNKVDRGNVGDDETSCFPAIPGSDSYQFLYLVGFEIWGEKRVSRL